MTDSGQTTRDSSHYSELRLGSQLSNMACTSCWKRFVIDLLTTQCGCISTNTLLILHCEIFSVILSSSLPFTQVLRPQWPQPHHQALHLLRLSTLHLDCCSSVAAATSVAALLQQLSGPQPHHQPQHLLRLSTRHLERQGEQDAAPFHFDAPSCVAPPDASHAPRPVCVCMCV